MEDKTQGKCKIHRVIPKECGCMTPGIGCDACKDFIWPEEPIDLIKLAQNVSMLPRWAQDQINSLEADLAKVKAENEGLKDFVDCIKMITSLSLRIGTEQFKRQIKEALRGLEALSEN